MADVYPTLSVITVNLKGLNPVSSQKMARKP